MIVVVFSGIFYTDLHMELYRLSQHPPIVYIQYDQIQYHVGRAIRNGILAATQSDKDLSCTSAYLTVSNESVNE